MTPREKWKAAKADLDAVWAERDALVAHLDDRLDAASEAEDLARDALPDLIGNCEGCSEPIFEGDLYLGGEYPTCRKCSPTWRDLADRPEDFVFPDGEPPTAETVKAAIAAHMASGGALSDSMAT